MERRTGIEYAPAAAAVDPGGAAVDVPDVVVDVVAAGPGTGLGYVATGGFCELLTGQHGR